MAYSIELTITNKKTAVGLEIGMYNTGLGALATGEALAPGNFEDTLPVCNTKDHPAGSIEIPVFGNNNQYIRLTAGDSVKVTVNSDAELAFYKAMAQEGALEVSGDEIVTDNIVEGEEGFVEETEE